MVINSIDLWNDHKKSQSQDPFVIDYFNEETEEFAYDKVLICPNLIGRYKTIYLHNNKEYELDSKFCTEFNGGLIFLKDGKPIRLYLCQVNDIVRKQLGHNYGVQDIMAELKSDKTVGKTGKTLLQLLSQNSIQVVVDEGVYSKYEKKGTIIRNDAVLESADCMGVLKSSTFLQNTDDWEAIRFNPDIKNEVGVISKDFQINIEHQGYIIGVKRNIGGLRPEVNGRKLYAIILQTGNAEEYKKMMDYIKNFLDKVHNNIEVDDNIYNALLDI